MYTFPDWKRHRSTYRYVHHLCTIFESRIVRGLLRPVLIITACSVAVAAYQTLHAMQLLPALMPALPRIPVEPFQLTSFALSLLLVFRTNSSYSRWYEGRRKFGRITTTCRDICRQMLALIPRANVASRALMARWLVAFCRASKWYIREDEPLEKELVPWLEPQELQQLVSSPHPPNFCILVLSHAVANSGLQDFAVIEEPFSILALERLCTKAERHISGMMLMDETTYRLVKTESQSHHFPSPWHRVMANGTGRSAAAVSLSSFENVGVPVVD
eukprot:gene4552-4804_t